MSVRRHRLSCCHRLLNGYCRKSCCRKNSFHCYCCCSMNDYCLMIRRKAKNWNGSELTTNDFVSNLPESIP
jgi:hypothetical protein